MSSFTLANLRNFTVGELLMHLDDRRSNSPIIEELCSRLELKASFSKDVRHNVECPVCQANLEADFDEGNNMFTIAIASESNI